MLALGLLVGTVHESAGSAALLLGQVSLLGYRSAFIMGLASSADHRPPRLPHGPPDEEWSLGA